LVSNDMYFEQKIEMFSSHEMTVSCDEIVL